MAPGEGLGRLDLQVVEQPGAVFDQVTADEEDRSDRSRNILLPFQRFGDQPTALLAQEEVFELVFPQDGFGHCGGSTAAVL